ncbi:MAG: YjfB family protein [Lachnospiraceae bacterium]|nr:YjfB family protein [Lachnospiraceae bacterium]
MDVTGVAALATYLSRAQTYNDVGYAVLDMSMDAMKMEGAGVAQMISSAPGMELSVNPSVGGNFDMSI